MTTRESVFAVGRIVCNTETLTNRQLASNPDFIMLCESVGIRPTPRQASKFRKLGPESNLVRSLRATYWS